MARRRRKAPKQRSGWIIAAVILAVLMLVVIIGLPKKVNLQSGEESFAYLEDAIATEDFEKIKVNRYLTVFLAKEVNSTDIELVEKAVEYFSQESTPDIPFDSPIEQETYIFSRPLGDFPGETTWSSNDWEYHMSMINLEVGEDFTDWGIDSNEYINAARLIQAICLSFARIESKDAMCNILSANAAAGYIGWKINSFKSWISMQETTDVAKFNEGTEDFKYQFLPNTYYYFETP